MSRIVANDPRNGAGAHSPKHNSRAAVRILVRGQVQGIGFRPFVYRLAIKYGLGGHVRNTPSGVLIDIEGSPSGVERFQQELAARPPSGAGIEGIHASERAPSHAGDFVIACSERSASAEVRLPPDLATCSVCAGEIFDSRNRRRGYPFTNCTSCGPRYSIIESMPYDRAGTVMRQFQICAACNAEYRTPSNRRFHAQPNACGICGPQVELWDKQGRKIAGADQAISAAGALIRQGKILALKGLGGFQLLARADASEPIHLLRERKGRPAKPLAVMVATLAAAERFGHVGELERELLESPQNPIVLVEKKNNEVLCEEIAPGVSTVGLFLPTTPLHHLLLREAGLPVVATSGNRSEEAIVIDEHVAVPTLGDIADAFLVHDRQIVRRVDDSVVRVIAGKPAAYRLARGLAPLPLPALERFGKRLNCPAVLATGGHQKAALALWTGSQAFLTQHIGDLDSYETRMAFERLVDDLSDLYLLGPATLACDLHPGYFTTAWAESQKQPIVRVQHHHAHAAACIVEHDLLDREVLAITWDGTGYGADATIWGGEILLATCRSFSRVASLQPFPLPGGEAAIREPCRIALSVLVDTIGRESFLNNPRLSARLGLSNQQSQVFLAMMDRGVNTLQTSSMGRLFDAVGALVLGIRNVSYEGEAAVRLEALADSNETGFYALPLRRSNDGEIKKGNSPMLSGDWRPTISAILADMEHEVEPSTIAARFHNTLARWAQAVAAFFPDQDIVLSGGCFQNRLLTERVIAALCASNRKVFWHNQIPAGDGGLAVGQLAVAMAKSQSILNE